MAKNAGVPIALGYMDYKNKVAGIGKVIWPTDNMESDMKKIMAYYQTITPCFPEKFLIDERYIP